MTSEDAKFYSISSKFKKPVSNKGQDLVVQFTVKNPEQDGGFCGGGYMKLLPFDYDATSFGGDSEYFIMFGPDICGHDVSRIHLIFNFDGENLLRDQDIKLEYDDKNELTHLYTLVVRPDNSYTVYFDEKEKAVGFLHDDWDFPAKEMPDPKDIKPDDWVDDEMINDPDETKPENWDSIKKLIPDPKAEQPEDWDEEDDGEWEPPMISNPEWKGEWKPTKVKNPEYNGPWIQKTTPNPLFQKDVYFYENIGAIGFELWVVNSGAVFDNIYIGNSLEEANKLAAETWGVISPEEEEAKRKYKELKDAEKKLKDEKMAKDIEEADDLAAEEEDLDLEPDSKDEL